MAINVCNDVKLITFSRCDNADELESDGNVAKFIGSFYRRDVNGNAEYDGSCYLRMNVDGYDGYCDICTDNELVSAHHCVIYNKDGSYYLYDGEWWLKDGRFSQQGGDSDSFQKRQSSNCTYLNGRRLPVAKSLKLTYGDEVRIGDIRFLINLP